MCAVYSSLVCHKRERTSGENVVCVWCPASMGKGGCAGMAVMFGPPTIGAMCYIVWGRGSARTWRSLQQEPSSSGTATFCSVMSVPSAYYLQRLILIRHFDEGGALSLDWKKGTESLGEPLKINTWNQFYRAAGPPVFARTAALIASFYIAGCVHAYVAAKPAEPPAKKPASKSKKR
jgi:hypothetical protein